MPSRQGDKEENVVIIYLKNNWLWYKNIYKNVILYYYHSIMAPIDGEKVTKENAPKFLESDMFKNITKQELMILSEEKTQSNPISMESRKFEPDIFKGEKIQSNQTSTESGKFERAIFQKREERQIN